MKVLGIIPSRFESTRLPGKPLINILGKTMIQRVYEQCLKCKNLDDVIVATDDIRILNHVKKFNGNAIMTSKSHQSGTDRCNEVINKIENQYEIVVNIQGDEPFIHPEQIDQVISLFDSTEIKITTLAKKITNPKIIEDNNIVKAILNENGMAQDFCRTLSKKDLNIHCYKHIGIYAYRSNILNQISKLKVSKNEQTKSLEQLRWLDNMIDIKVGITDYDSLSVDTDDDIENIKAYFG
tara:strand:- start:754 stop:1467 length:714 start_codon:yes stop_codon:yes gene_type:complete